MTELSHNSLKAIFKYLMGSTVFKGNHPDDVLRHIRMLEKYGQMDWQEDVDNNLVYACAWWKLSEKALEDVKRGVAPKRFNRGPNLVGVFWLQPQAMGVGMMKRVIKRVIRMERAKSLHIYNRSGRWFGLRTSSLHNGKDWSPMKRSKVQEVMDVLTGGRKPCPQQSR
jgi:hypothetical protein